MDQAAALMPMAMVMAREPPAEELLVFSVEDTAPRPNSCTMPASAGGGGEERRPGPSAAAPERVPAAAAAVADTMEPREGTVEQLTPTPQSICKPKAVQHPKHKRKTIDLKTLWTRVGKKSKACIQVEKQVHDVSPSVQQLQIASAINVEPKIVSEASEESENVGEEDDSEDGIYDVQLLEPDPGLRIPIADYDVNDQDRIRRRFIARDGFE
ncbi:uncharacterized protein [Triticum aestivum]|uniref:uncharacterized protein isoform X2 n=1 Tax=Triticum aestivum TaxID=4565 RepID=UPI001D0020C9|nr:uncharacterized protein LOC123066600 isoform X2 [Triticum aestivum]